MKKFYSKFNIAICGVIVLQLFTSSIRSQNPITGYAYAGTYNGHVYYLSDCTSDWYNANTAASEMGGYLVSITDMAENNFVLSMVPAGSNAWIGLHFDCSICTWSSGEPIVFVYFYKDNWSNPWFAMRGSNGYWDDGKWYDYDASAIHRYIIEFDSNPDCNNPNKQYVCHNGNTICINNDAVQAHLDHGDFQGPCSGCNDPNSMQAVFNDIPEAEYGDSHVVTPAIEDLSDASSVNHGINLFPNPTTREVSIMFPVLKHEGEGQIKIYDPFGKELLTRQLNPEENRIHLDLDESRFSCGIYYVVLVANGNLQTKRLIISR